MIEVILVALMFLMCIFFVLVSCLVGDKLNKIIELLSDSFKTLLDIHAVLSDIESTTCSIDDEVSGTKTYRKG